MNRSIRLLLLLMAGTVAAAAITLQLRSGEAAADSTYVGQEKCFDCHAGPYSDSSDYQGETPFRATLHQKIHLRPSPETVVVENYFAGDSVAWWRISGVQIQGRDTLLVHFSKSPDGKTYYVQMKMSGGGDSLPRMKVEYTYGGYGWAQQFLVKINRSYHMVPTRFKLPAYGRHSSEGAGYFFVDVNRWLYVDSTTAGEAKFFNWNTNNFRSKAWDRDCFYCHVNGADAGVLVSGSDTTFVSNWVGKAEGDSALQDQNIKIGCESCHGPGSEHVANPTVKGNIVSPKTFGNSTSGIELKLDLCGACHTRTQSTQALFRFPRNDSTGVEYIPGQPMLPYIKDRYAAMNTWADRITSYAHHQAGQDFSRSRPHAAEVFKNGCWDCHTTHRPGVQGLPYQLNRNWYSLNDGEGCLNCHGSRATLVDTSLRDLSITENRSGKPFNLHSQHSQEVSQCVNCHFTRTASIGFIDLPEHPLYEFSDHSFRVIRPTATREFAPNSLIGMINTCAASCHRNGRGSRNYLPSTPVAPDFGIVDQAIGFWKEPSDFSLADSLWYHYQRLYADLIVSSVQEPDVSAAGSRISMTAPNPFSSATTISYSLVTPGNIALEVYDATGSLVRVLENGRRAAGSYKRVWDGTRGNGAAAASGTYFVTLKTPENVSTLEVKLAR